VTGRNDILDARLCLQIARGFLVGTAAQRGQVDSDGDVDATDTQILAEYVIGIRSTLP